MIAIRNSYAAESKILGRGTHTLRSSILNSPKSKKSLG